MRNFLLSMLILCSASAFAQTGFGQRTCGRWVEARTQKSIPKYQIDDLAMESWVAGFMTGMNYMAFTLKDKMDVLKQTDAPSAYLYIDNYCNKNPLSMLDEAASHLYIDLVTKDTPK